MEFDAIKILFLKSEIEKKNLNINLIPLYNNILICLFEYSSLKRKIFQETKIIHTSHMLLIKPMLGKYNVHGLIGHCRSLQ